MTDKAQRTVYIKWVRSGIGFTHRQKAAIRSLGLRRLHHVVERADTPQIRGLVARIPNLVEIVKEAPKPAPWASVQEYTIVPKAIESAATAVSDAAPAIEEVPAPAEPAVEIEAAPALKTGEPPVKLEKAPKAAKPAAVKAKPAKKAKEPEKKKVKAAEKPAKAAKGKK